MMNTTILRRTLSVLCAIAISFPNISVSAWAAESVQDDLGQIAQKTEYGIGDDERSGQDDFGEIGVEVDEVDDNKALLNGSSEKSLSQTESYVGMDMNSGQTWMVGVTVTSPSGGLPSADDGAYVSCEPVAADELSAAVAAAYDGQPGYAVALRLKVVGPDGSEAALPEGCSVRVRLIDGNGGASPKAFSLAGGALSALASYDYAGDDGMAAPGQMFDVAVDGDAALLAAPIAWVDTAGLTEKSLSQTESYVGMDMNSGQTWMVGVTVTSPSGGLPSADDGAYVSCEPVAADELSAAVAAAYDGQPGYAVALRLKVVGPDGSEAALPEGCSVRVRLIDGNGGASPKAFSLAGGALSALASYDYAGDDGMAAPGQMFDVAVDGDAALLAAPIAWVDTAGLTEKGAETTLSPGTYSVCANLFVKGEDNLILSGITAYLTGSSIPPTMPCRTNNATLVVGEDKSLTLKLDLDTVPAEVFTLQDIQSGDDVEVLSTVRGVGPNYDKYVSTGDPSVYRSDRIKSLSLKLNNAKGEYSFGACTEFPTLIGRDMNMPLTLSVDFSSAKKAFDPGDGKNLFEKTFLDSATGVSAHVKTTEASLGEKLEKADFSIFSNTEDSSAIEKVLADRFASMPSYWAYKAVFACEGEPVELFGNTFVEWTVPWDSDAVSAYSWNGTELTSIESSLSDGVCTFADEKACNFVVLNPNGAYEWLSKTSADSETQIFSTISISTVHEFAEGWLGFAELHASKGEMDGGVRYNVVWKNTASEGKFNFAPSSMKVTFTIPADEGQAIYLIQDSGTSRLAKKVAVGTSAGTATFDFFESTDSENEIDRLSEAMLRAYDGDAPTEDAPIAYFAVKQGGDSVESDLVIAKALSYTGQPQQGFELGENIEVVEGDGVSQTNAGDYKTKIQPKDGFTWFDGTREVREIDWSISKVQLQTSYRIGLPWDADIDKLPNVDDVKQSLLANMTGFVNGESRDTVSDFEFSVEQGPKMKEAVKDGFLQPATSYGYVATLSAQNYELSSVAQYNAALAVVGVEPQDEPVVQEGLAYTGLEQTGLAYNSKFDFTDVSGEWMASLGGRDAGSYVCTATPKYAWSDGTFEPRTISFEIAPAVLTATYKGDNAGASSDEAKGEVEVSGFVNGETAATIENFKSPSVTLPDALVAGKEYELTPEGGYAGKNYVFEYVAGKLVVDASFAPAAVYTLTANLSMPGEYNPVLSGVDVYVNNPNNPFTDKAGKSPVLDGASGEGVAAEAPTKPLDGNAKVTVAADGSKTLVLDLPNPVFTLQELGTCADLPEGSVSVETKQPADKSVWDYGKYDTRICRVSVKLPADAKGTVTYTFTGSKLYAVPLNADIQPEAGKPALRLVVDLDSAKESGSAAVDRSALEKGIASAEAALAGVVVSADGSDVSTEGTWVSQEAADAFRRAIDAAKSMDAEKLVSQQMIDDALAALNEASAAFSDQAKPGLKDERVKVEKPAAASGLIYNGLVQTGVQASEGFVLSGAEGKDAGDYVATATLKDGFTWADGTVDPVEVTWSIAKAKLVATYAGETVSPGAKPGLGVEVTGFVGGETALSAAGYQAPSVSAPASLEAGKTYELVPSGGAAANYEFVYVGGTLKVEKASSGTLKAGTYAITANLSMPGDYNPVISGATVYVNNPNNPFRDKAGHEPVLDGNNPVGVVSTTPTTPLTKNATLVVAADGTKTLELDVLNPVFTTQELGTCAELADVQVTRKAPADASVWSYGKYDTRISHVSVKLTDDMVTGAKSYYFSGSKLYAVPLGMDIAPSGSVALELSVNYSSLPASALPDGVDPVPDPDPEPTPTPDPTPTPTPTPAPSPAQPGGSTEVGTTTDGHFAAGVYTVSANLWFDKATTGLPLNPHLTNGGFPPSTPVRNNATMTVDASGHAWVSAPVVIQDKVMTINNVWGGGVSYDGSTVTIDLGTPTASRTSFAGTCTSSVTIGWLARTIAAGIFNGVWDHTWSTNWEVDLGSTLPASGGGQLPAEAQAILNGENGVSGEGDAAAAALAAAEDGSAKADGAAAGKTADGKAAGSAKGGVAGAVEDLAEAAASNPAAAVAIGCVVAAVVAAAAAGGVYAYRRKRRPAAGEVGDAAK